MSACQHVSLSEIIEYKTTWHKHKIDVGPKILTACPLCAACFWYIIVIVLAVILVVIVIISLIIIATLCVLLKKMKNKPKPTAEIPLEEKTP